MFVLIRSSQDLNPQSRDQTNILLVLNALQGLYDLINLSSHQGDLQNVKDKLRTDF